MTIQLRLQSTLLRLGTLLRYQQAMQGNESTAATMQVQQMGNTRTAVMTLPVSEDLPGTY